MQMQLPQKITEMNVHAFVSKKLTTLTTTLSVAFFAAGKQKSAR